MKTAPLKNRMAVAQMGKNGEIEIKPKKKDEIKIKPLRQAIVTIPIIGTSPLKILRFSAKNHDKIKATMEAGSQARSRRNREARNFEQDYEEAKYYCVEKQGRKTVKWLGLNASGVRNACVETCRVADAVMTKAKMSIFCLSDGIDAVDRSTPLVRIYGKEEMTIDHVRNTSGVIDLRARVMWPEWKCLVRLRFDEDQFSVSDILNLMVRVGEQNGLGEGRPNSSNGNGTGHGLFAIDMDGIEVKRTSVVPMKSW